MFEFRPDDASLMICAADAWCCGGCKGVIGRFESSTEVRSWRFVSLSR